MSTCKSINLETTTHRYNFGIQTEALSSDSKTLHRRSRSARRVEQYSSDEDEPTKIEAQSADDMYRNVVTDKQQIMKFYNEGVSTSALAIPDIVGIPRNVLKETMLENFDHSIQNFLSRPIIIQQLNFLSSSTANVAGANLITQDFPDALLTNNMYFRKLAGFLGIRATLVLRLQVNSMPFQQGRFILSYIPYANKIPGRALMINSTLAGITGCPRADLDLSTDTECILRIPYVSPYTFYNLPGRQGTFGSAYVTTYSPLISGATTDQIGFTFWAHLEDVEISFPTGVDPDNSGPLKIVAQSSEQEIYHSNTTNLGQPVSAVGKIVNDLENFSLKPSWFANTAANVASLFGFSKPTNQVSISKTKLQTASHMAASNTEDNSHPMGLFANNMLEDLQYLKGSSEDQMALTKVVTVPNYIENFNWDTSQTAGSLLWNNNVNPIQQNSSGLGSGSLRTTHCSYVANTFGLWRGSLNYTFKFVKTKFHSGRVRILFIPGAFNITSLASIDPNACYSQIVDLRTANEFTFKVPYVSSRPYLCVKGINALNTDELYYSTGTIAVVVLNELINAQDAYAKVNVIVEFAGGDDIEFAAFGGPRYYPFLRDAPTEEKKKVKSDPIKDLIKAKRIAAQSLGDDQALTRDQAQNGDLSDDLTRRDVVPTFTPSALCVGERVQSIRQLIKRFCLYVGGTTDLNDKAYIINPWAIQDPIETSTTSTFTVDMIDYFSYLYAFYRGGMRLKTNLTESEVGITPWKNVSVKMFNTFSDNSPALSINPDTRILPLTSFPDKQRLHATSEQVINRDLEGAIEIEVPFYSQSYIVPLSMGKMSSSSVFAAQQDGFMPLNLLTLQPRPYAATIDDAYSIDIYRAAADDFSFSYLLGVPPISPIP